MRFVLIYVLEIDRIWFRGRMTTILHNNYLQLLLDFDGIRWYVCISSGFNDYLLIWAISPFRGL